MVNIIFSTSIFFFFFSTHVNEVDIFFFFSDDYLLIGTREGHLLMYNIATNSTDVKSIDNKSPSLYRYSKNFSKKRIVQIAVVPEYNLLILLTGKFNYNYVYQKLFSFFFLIKKFSSLNKLQII